jgi:hypothetical protein
MGWVERTVPERTVPERNRENGERSNAEDAENAEDYFSARTANSALDSVDATTAYV